MEFLTRLQCRVFKFTQEICIHKRRSASAAADYHAFIFDWERETPLRIPGKRISESAGWLVQVSIRDDLI
jgi:hypothetical protein